MIKAYAVPVRPTARWRPLMWARTCWMRRDSFCRPGASDDLEGLARAAFERQAGWIAR